MAFTVWGDGSRLKFDGRRRNHLVTLNNIPELKDTIGFAYDFPGVLPELPLPYFGRQVPYSSQEDWEVEFVNDYDFKNRDFFEQWCNNINCGIWKTATATVQMTKAGEIIETKVTPPLIPIYISPIECCWDCNDQIEKFTVKFLVNPLPFDVVEELPLAGPCHDDAGEERSQTETHRRPREEMDCQGEVLPEKSRKNFCRHILTK